MTTGWSMWIDERGYVRMEMAFADAEQRDDACVLAKQTGWRVVEGHSENPGHLTITIDSLEPRFPASDRAEM